MFKWNIEKVMMLMGYRKIMTNVPPIPHFLDWQGDKCQKNAQQMPLGRGRACLEIILTEPLTLWEGFKFIVDVKKW